MTCLETSFLVDLLRDDDAATDVAADIVDAGERPTVTSVAAAEVWVGAELGSIAERDATEALIESLTWLDLTRGSARLAGEIQAELIRDGIGIGFTDCLIAAIAIDNGETLVSGDSDFERIPGVDLRTY